MREKVARFEKRSADEQKKLESHKNHQKFVNKLLVQELNEEKQDEQEQLEFLFT